MANKLIVPAIVGALVIGGGSFFGGLQYQKSQVKTNASAQGARGGRLFVAGGPGMAGRNGAGFATGQVVSKDATSLTVKLANGGSSVVFYSTSTRIGKMTEGTIADVETGSEVTIQGASNADGSMTATSIQLRPAETNRPSRGSGA